MVPTGERNMPRVNQTGGITTNYGGRLIPHLWTSEELLRWKKNRMRTSEGGKKQFTPRFYCWPWTSGTETAGWFRQELSFSRYFNTASRLCVVKFMNYPSSVQVPWTLQWIKLGNINFFCYILRLFVCRLGDEQTTQGHEQRKETEMKPALREGESVFGLVEVRGRNGSCSCLIGRQYDTMVLIEQNQFGRSNYRSCQQYPWFITTCPTALMAQLTFEHSTKWKDLTFQTVQNKTMPENPSGTIKVTAIMCNFSLIFSSAMFFFFSFLL